MALPDYESLMLPLLRCVADGERPVQNAITALAGQLELSPDERQALLPSGRTPVFNSRVHWAGTYLVQAGLLSRPRRGVLQITERGISVLAEIRRLLITNSSLALPSSIGVSCKIWVTGRGPGLTFGSALERDRSRKSIDLRRIDENYFESNG
jgi:restriction endonuclease Mrr